MQALVEHHKKYGRKFVGGEWKERTGEARSGSEALKNNGSKRRNTATSLNVSRREGDHESLQQVQTSDGHERAWQERAQHVGRWTGSVTCGRTGPWK